MESDAPGVVVDYNHPRAILQLLGLIENLNLRETAFVLAWYKPSLSPNISIQ